MRIGQNFSSYMALGSNYNNYLLAAAASRLADAILPIAVSFAVLDQGGTAIDLAAVLIASRAATPLLVLVGGVAGDVLSRVYIMRVADILRLALQLSTAGLIMTGSPSMWVLAGLQFLSGAAAGFFDPAANALLPSIIPQNQLQTGNSWLAVVRNIAGIVAQPISALIVVLVNPGAAFFATAIMYGTSFFLLLRVRSPRHERSAEPAGHIFRQIANGARYVREQRWILISALHLGLLNAVGMAPVFVLGPIVAEIDLDGAASWGIVMLSYGVGSLLGGLAAMRVKPARPVFVAMSATVLCVPLLWFLAIGANVWLVGGAAVLSGLQGSVTNVLVMTEVQSRTPIDLLSRVSSVLAVTSLVLLPIGMGVSGVLADLFGNASVLAFAGVTILVATAVVVLTRSVRSVERLVPSTV